MTLVLSMKPFLDAEGDPALKTYQPKWEVVDHTKTSLTNAASPHGPEEQFTQEAPCRRVPCHISASRFAFFKRKCVHDDEPIFNFRTYYQMAAPALEERTHVLRLSMEKMRFIDDPEAFLRRSVLVNNLLRRLRTEILLQSSDWSFPLHATLSSAPCVRPFHALQQALPTHVSLAPQAGPPLCKRIRVVGGGDGEPFSWYGTALSICPSSPKEDENVEEGTAEETIQEDKKRQQKSSSDQKSRTEPLLPLVHTRTEDGCRTHGVQPEKEQEDQRNAAATEVRVEKERRASPRSRLVLPDNCG